jgi:predicted RNA binding protein YcfA (HicA-like mRNA interferase family)
MNFRPLSYREVIKKARKAGFAFRRATGGTHEIWWNEEKRKTCVIPHHKEIKAGTVKSIIKQMDLTPEEFCKL